jgi:hypothetical protein
MYEVFVASSRNETFLQIDVGDLDPSDLLALMAHSPSAAGAEPLAAGHWQVRGALSPLRETPQTHDL